MWYAISRGSGGSFRFGPDLRHSEVLHRTHLMTVPFENLDVLAGCPVDLDEAALFEKIVRRRAADSCYELNGLFAMLLRAIGFRVDLLAAGMAHAGGRFDPDYDHWH